MGLDIGDLDRFLAEYDVDDNIWWTLSFDEMKNVFDALLARCQELDAKCDSLEDQLQEDIDRW